MKVKLLLFGRSWMVRVMVSWRSVLLFLFVFLFLFDMDCFS